MWPASRARLCLPEPPTPTSRACPLQHREDHSSQCPMVFKEHLARELQPQIAAQCISSTVCKMPEGKPALLPASVFRQTLKDLILGQCT